ncbi:PIG-L deacetylase family protein [Planctomycetota bacterium]
MKVLAIGAHHDDIETGCGGSLLVHSQNNDSVHTVIVSESGFCGSDGQEVRSSSKAKEENEVAATILGVEKTTTLGFKTNDVTFDESLVLGIRKIIDNFEPDLVYSHWGGDAHLDHCNVARATIAACRHVPSILTYQSNWYKGTIAFNPAYYRDISRTFELKIKALKAYEGEFSRRGQDWIRFIESTNSLYGLQCSVRWAEAFEVVRMTAL